MFKNHMYYDCLMILSLACVRADMPAEVQQALEGIDYAGVCSRLLVVASGLQIDCKKADAFLFRT